MKTTILAIATLFITLSGVSQSTYASSGNTEESTILTGVNNISEIEIHGNVELYVSGGTADQVKVYNRYYSNNALIQDENGVLRISSYGTQKLKVWVTASELQKLSVYDNAEVKSFGRLSAIDLDVKLYNNALAQIDLDAFTANITLNDTAKADLTGNVIHGSLLYDQSSFLNTTNLNVLHLNKSLKSYKTSIDYTVEPVII